MGGYSSRYIGLDEMSKEQFDRIYRIAEAIYFREGSTSKDIASACRLSDIDGIRLTQHIMAVHMMRQQNKQNGRA